MKRFKLKIPKSTEVAIITVDDEDAYILRSERWFAKIINKNHIHIYQKKCGVTYHLSHRLLGINGHQDTSVYFKNRDDTDFRKENLVNATAYEYAMMLHKENAPLSQYKKCAKGHILTIDNFTSGMRCKRCAYDRNKIYYKINQVVCA